MVGPGDRDPMTGRIVGVESNSSSNRRRMQRTRSNLSSTSTSSDIQVAAPPSASPSIPTASNNEFQRRARVEDGRMLIVPLPLQQENFHQRSTRHNANAPTITGECATVDQPQSTTLDDGRNDRGTYSREYMQQHPEIQWVHRGQGRYLPASEVRQPAATYRQPARFVPPENSLLPRLGRQLPPPADTSPLPTGGNTFPEEPLYEMRVEYNTLTGAPHFVSGRLSSRTEFPPAGYQQRGHYVGNHMVLAQPPRPPPPHHHFPPGGLAPATSTVAEFAEMAGRVAAAETLLDLATPNYINANRSPRPSRGRPSQGMDGAADELDEPAGNATALPVPRKRRAVEEMLSDSLSGIPQYGLRNKYTKPQTPTTTDIRASRLARRAKTTVSVKDESPILSRAQQLSYEEHSAEESDDDGTDEGKSKGRTYRREYVDDHPELVFHHTGNGWWKLGDRPQAGIKSAKHRDSVDDTFTKNGDHSGALELGGTIHSDDLSKYPGREFHHTGNSWYRAGPDPAGKRTSIVVPTEQSDNEADEDVKGTVSKEYKEGHPEIEWVHRGNGRYKRKAAFTTEDSLPSVASPIDRFSEQRASKTETFDKAYVLAHPNEDFYHTGNARYKRGRKPLVSASSRDESEPPEEEEVDEPGTLFDKAYVEAHPLQEFHHRGQGRYARGPRPSAVSTRIKREPTLEEEETYEDEDQDEDDEMFALVDSDYVDAHPDEVFHHRGQGRWARGLPPPGSSRKMAVRGPDSKDKDKAVTQSMEDEEEDVERPPVLTALVSRAEGPDRWGELDWHYRGGGKWGRVTKTEWERIMQVSRRLSNPAPPKKMFGRKVRTSTSSGQLGRDMAKTALNGGAEYDDTVNMDGGMDVDAPVVRKVIKRRGRGSLRAQGEISGGAKDTSNPHSKEPSPKLAMLTSAEEEAEFQEVDGISIYNPKWSPPAGEETQLDKYYRKNFHSLNTDKLYTVITKYDPGQRSIDHAKRILEKLQREMQVLEDEYHKLDQITAPKQKIPRKPIKGRAVPVDDQIFEDRKEADLYGYHFDPRKIGHQDPEAQRIVLDAEGRELRKRRNRTGIDVNGAVQTGEGDEMLAKRASRQPNRFDNIIEPARKRQRNNLGAKAGSLTPDRSGTPLALPSGYQVPTSGRWAGHVPKRIRELRDESVVTVRSEGGTVTQVRKGRPPGSKNRQVRKDAGIKKGPRKPKAVASEDEVRGGFGEEEDDLESGEEV